MFTKPKPEEELKGLVYSLTPKIPAEKVVWYKRPVVLVLAATIIFIILNIVFW